MLTMNATRDRDMNELMGAREHNNARAGICLALSLVTAAYSGVLIKRRTST
jgi:hypothetical protein